MRRVVLFLVAGTLLLTLSAGFALAVNIVKCQTSSCFGTDGEDRIYEQEANGKSDVIYAKDNPRGTLDVVSAQRYNTDEDKVFGDGGNDRIRTDDGDTLDTVNCGTGTADIAVIDDGETATADCEDVRVQYTGTAAQFATASRATILSKSMPAKAQNSVQPS